MMFEFNICIVQHTARISSKYSHLAGVDRQTSQFEAPRVLLYEVSKINITGLLTVTDHRPLDHVLLTMHRCFKFFVRGFS